MCISTRDSWFNQRIDTEFDNRRESDVGPISMAIGFSQKNKKKMVMYPEQDLIL